MKFVSAAVQHPSRARLRRRLIRLLSRAHRGVVHASRGRLLGRVAGMPVLLLTTTGRRTGKKRTVPLTYLRDGDDYVIVGSFGGSDRPPAWWVNLEHEPRAVVRRAGARLDVTARTADPDERTRLWPLVTAAYPGYGRYQARTNRPIPVVLLTPAGDRSSAGS
jgi:deazaflavin-dependent oxidoreductase (nitroreductase family)